jgi:hypothetical protein
MSDSELDHNYPGVDRLQYFLSKAGMIAAVVFVVTVFGPDSPVMKVVGFALLVGGFVLDVMRLRNIGVSQWFAMLRFFPFGSTILDISLLSAQTGWIETRQLDRAGKTIATFLLVLLALMLFLFLRMHVAIPNFI